MATALGSFADIRTQAMTARSAAKRLRAQDQSSKCRFPRSALQTSPRGVVYRQKKGEEARGFTTVRGAPQNGDGRFRDHAPDGSAALQNLYFFQTWRQKF